ncbi:hypothetical protein DL771_008059 [Monosporascus sp. 5C6A]|nr:hypothetical protein DL771_008059 [Monosporascus sp. 5C6A]
MSENQESEKKGDGKQGASRPSSKEKLLEEIHKRIEDAKPLQEESMELHRRAEEATDPKEAEELRSRAKELDREASKLLKTAERLQAGWMQGGAMGGGIGAGVAGGIGTAVGTLVGGLTAIPTAGLGMLIGAGTGLVHGPWVKFTDTFSKQESDDIVNEAEEEAKKIAES